MIKVRTVIGHGCPSKEGSHSAHGAPLGAKNVAETKAKLGLDQDKSFQVPEAVAEYYSAVKSSGDLVAGRWKTVMAEYTEKYPAEGAALARRILGDVPENWESGLTTYSV